MKFFRHFSERGWVHYFSVLWQFQPTDSQVIQNSPFHRDNIHQRGEGIEKKVSNICQTLPGDAGLSLYVSL